MRAQSPPNAEVPGDLWSSVRRVRRTPPTSPRRCRPAPCEQHRGRSCPGVVGRPNPRYPRSCAHADLISRTSVPMRKTRPWCAKTTLTANLTYSRDSLPGQVQRKGDCGQAAQGVQVVEAHAVVVAVDCGATGDRNLVAAFKSRLYGERNVLGLAESGQVSVDSCAVWTVGAHTMGDELDGWVVCHIDEVGGQQMRGESVVLRSEGLCIDSQRSGHVAVVCDAGFSGDACESSSGREQSPHRLLAEGSGGGRRHLPVPTKRALD